MFSIGQKIVCIDDKKHHALKYEMFKQWVTVNTTYTVRGIRPPNAGGGILLEEINNPPCYFSDYGGNIEPAFNPSRFVPLQDEKEGSVMEQEQVVEGIGIG